MGVPGATSTGLLQSTGPRPPSHGRTEPSVLPDDRLNRIGIIWGDEGVDEPTEIEDKADLLFARSGSTCVQ